MDFNFFSQDSDPKPEPQPQPKKEEGKGKEKEALDKNPTEVGGGPSTNKLMLYIKKVLNSISKLIIKFTNPTYNKNTTSSSHTLSNLSDKVLFLSHLRRFDISILIKLLPKFFPNEFDGEKLSKYMVLLEGLLRSDVAKWSHEYQGYSVKNEMKEDVQNSGNSLSKIEQFNLHLQVLHIYEELMIINKEYQTIYIPEILYHKSQLLTLSGESSSSVINNLRAEIKNYLFSLRESSGILANYQLEMLARIENDSFYISLFGKKELDNFTELLRYEVNLHAKKSDHGVELINNAKLESR